MQTKPIPGYAGHYEISENGDVRRLISTSVLHRKLTDVQVENVLALHAIGRSVASIARMYEVTSVPIQRIISNKGYRPYRGATLKPALRRDGYPFVALSKDGIVKQYTVHQLVLLAFIGPPEPGQHANHRDGNKQNPALSNLEYVTRSENMRHSVDVLGHSHKLNYEQAAYILSQKGFKSRKELAAMFGISIYMVTAIWIKKSWFRQKYE